MTLVIIITVSILMSNSLTSADKNERQVNIFYVVLPSVTGLEHVAVWFPEPGNSPKA